MIGKTGGTKKPEDWTPTMYGPAIYKIRVRGHLDDEWSDRLGGVQVTATHGLGGVKETLIIGCFSDQGALTGVLNTLYELHLPVVSVDCVDKQG